MIQRTIPQNRKFSAMVNDVALQYPLAPYKRALAREAWKRYFIARFVYEVRLEAYGAGEPDPFPVRPVPSRSLDDRQMNELIECTFAIAAQDLGLILE